MFGDERLADHPPRRGPSGDGVPNVLGDLAHLKKQNAQALVGIARLGENEPAILEIEGFPHARTVRGQLAALSIENDLLEPEGDMIHEFSLL